MAPQRAIDAEKAYLNSLQNAWKGSDANSSGGANIMRDARLKPPSWQELLGDK